MKRSPVRTSAVKKSSLSSRSSITYRKAPLLDGLPVCPSDEPAKIPHMSRTERFRRLFDMGCIACRIHNTWMYCAPQMHHLVDFGYRDLSGGDRATIPLCPWHHAGQPSNGASEKVMEQLFGPSMKLNSKAFRDRFGTQRELLAIVDNKIGAPPYEPA